MQCIIFYQNKLLVQVIPNINNLLNKQISSPYNYGHKAFVLPHKLAMQNILTNIDLVLTNSNEFAATLKNLDNLNIEYNTNSTTHTDGTELIYKLIGLRAAMNYFDTATISRVIYYKQLYHYYNTHKFCGSCSSETTRNSNNHFVRCDKCNHDIYPHIAPCIVVRIHKNDQILMARGVNFSPNNWGLIAGFVEINECLEAAVIREVKEEVGIDIEDVSYWGSQSWPFPNNSLLICFTAKYKAGEITPDLTEIAEAGFFSANDIPGKPSTSYSITSQMIEEFINNQLH